MHGVLATGSILVVDSPITVSPKGIEVAIVGAFSRLSGLAFLELEGAVEVKGGRHCSKSSTQGKEDGCKGNHCGSVDEAANWNAMMFGESGCSDSRPERGNLPVLCTSKLTESKVSEQMTHPTHHVVVEVVVFVIVNIQPGVSDTGLRLPLPVLGK